MASAQAPPPKKLRVFFIPFYVSSHLIPMTDIARLFAERGVDSTLVVTPANAALIRRTVDRARHSGYSLNLLLHPFPSAEVGLPDGKENLGSVPLSDHGKIYRAVDLARDAHERILRENRPDAVVADVPYWWTTGIARDLGIPRITFHAVGAFAQLVMNKIAEFQPHDDVAGESEPFLVPGLPDPVEMVRSELPEFLRIRDQVTDNFAKIKEAQLGCYGVVLNTFYQLEPAYVDQYRKEDCRSAWALGPLSLCYGGGPESASRGGDESSAANECETLSWLDSKKRNSVVFVCFGSFNAFGKEQMRELALGLEASSHPFLWVARYDGDESDWLPNGFEERVGERGLIVRGWAPQAAILNHGSTGAFVTHCGWNSAVECVGAGVPMITWPLAFDQFINERLLVQILKIGIRMWGGYRSSLVEERVVFTGAAIAETVKGFMDGGNEAEGIRKRAGEYAEMARSAVKESGSSCEDLNCLIEELMVFK